MNLKAIFLSAIVGTVVLLVGVSHNVWGEKPEKESICSACHVEYRSLLPALHPSLQKEPVPSCLYCHEPAVSEEPLTNAFSALIHLGHKDSADCLECHTWKEESSFDLPHPGAALGKPSDEDMHWIEKAFDAWADSPYLASLHASHAVTCSGCHGKNLPLMDDTVENERCLACHGPMEKLVERSAPQDFPDRNPHLSHLGEIACTVCHRSHWESEVYCLGCHQNFDMKIPGAKY